MRRSLNRVKEGSTTVRTVRRSLNGVKEGSTTVRTIFYDPRKMNTLVGLEPPADRSNVLEAIWFSPTASLTLPML
jgi:hypothetical protein